jgi:hypothetical protein
MLLKSSRNFSTRTNGSSGLQIHNNQSMKKTALTNSLLKTSPSHRKRRVTGRQRRTPENGVISTKYPSTTLMNVAQNSLLLGNNTLRTNKLGLNLYADHDLKEITFNLSPQYSNPFFTHKHGKDLLTFFYRCLM